MKILVVEASALHLGFVGCYGNDWVATPCLDRLAAAGIVFDQHIAEHPEFASARPWWQRSAITGQYAFSTAREMPAPEGVIRYERVAAVQDFARQVLALCRETAEPILWIDGPTLAPPWRLPEDLLTVYADENESEEPPLVDPMVGVAPLDLDELDRLQITYAAVVTFFDAQLGSLLEQLPLDRLIVCVTARCGMPLNEHGMTGTPRAWLHDELVHVPLIVRLPGDEDTGLRIAALTQTLDLLPTLRFFLGDRPPALHGQSLWSLVHGEIEQIRPYAVSALRMGESEEWLLRTADRALLVPIRVPADDPPRRVQLYVKPDDRWEVNDLALRFEEEAEQLAQVLRCFVEATRGPEPLVYPPLPEETVAVAEEAS
jgi:arylsulfatase A-like enzyme